jgi:hypothetical protein
MFRNSVDTFDNLHSTVLELLDNMIADETLTEEEVRVQLKHFIVEYKFELDLHGAVDTPTMVSLAVLIMGNIGWLQHQDLIPIDDNNGMFFANFL